MPNTLRKQFRAEHNQPSVSVPVSTYRPITRANPGKQGTCRITSHKGTKPKCPTFCQYLGCRAAAVLQRGWDCSEEDCRILHLKEYSSCSSSPQEEEEIQTGLVPSISNQLLSADQELPDSPQRMSMHVSAPHHLQPSRNLRRIIKEVHKRAQAGSCVIQAPNHPPSYIRPAFPTYINRFQMSDTQWVWSKVFLSQVGTELVQINFNGNHVPESTRTLENFALIFPQCQTVHS